MITFSVTAYYVGGEVLYCLKLKFVNNLLKTNVSLLKACLTQLISPKRDIQEDHLR